MLITNVTDVRHNISKVIKSAAEKKEPVVVMQRSKPVAYIIEASMYEEIQKKLTIAEKIEKREMKNNYLKKQGGEVKNKRRKKDE